MEPETSAQRNDRSWLLWQMLAIPVLVFILVIGYWVLWPPSGCHNNTLTPEWRGEDGAGRPTEIFRVPPNNWVVARMDGIYKVVDPGQTFLNAAGMFVCDSPDAADKEAALLNKGDAEQEQKVAK